MITVRLSATGHFQFYVDDEPIHLHQAVWLVTLFDHGDELVETLTRLDALSSGRLDPALRLHLRSFLEDYDRYIAAQMAG